MSETLIIAAISFAGTMAGTLGGILTSSKLTNYRLEQLEKKVDLQGGFAQKLPVIDEQIKVINHRLRDLEAENEVFPHTAVPPS